MVVLFQVLVWKRDSACIPAECIGTVHEPLYNIHCVLRRKVIEEFELTGVVRGRCVTNVQEFVRIIRSIPAVIIIVLYRRGRRYRNANGSAAQPFGRIQLRNRFALRGFLGTLGERRGRIGGEEMILLGRCCTVEYFILFDANFFIFHDAVAAYAFRVVL